MRSTLYRLWDSFHANSLHWKRIPMTLMQVSRNYGYLRVVQPSLLRNVDVKYGLAFYCENSQNESDHNRPNMRNIEPQEITPLVTVTELTKFFAAHSLSYEVGYTSFILQCPVCLHTEHDEFSTCGKLHVNKITGKFICYDCKSAGSWSTFREFIGALKNSKDVRRPTKAMEGVFPTDDVLERVQKTFDNLTPVFELKGREFQQVMRRFKMKSVLPNCFGQFDVRISNDMLSLFFPIRGPDKEIVALNILHASVGNGEKLKLEEMTLFPSDTVIGLFGLVSVRDSQHEIILTSTPMDAMAAYQETGVPTIALPKGISHLPPEVLPLFEKFEKITIWFANTMHEWESGKAFAHKLNKSRCYFVPPQDDHPRPLIALQKGLCLKNVLKMAQPIAHKSITTFKSLRKEVKAELQYIDQVAGIRWKRYSAMNRILKGHRRGELTIFTGPTGAGKTTFMSEYSLDLCMQGVSTLWGSFEIRNPRLAKVMLTQFAQVPLHTNLDQFDHWADKFELLPLYFMVFHGEQSLRHVLDAMSHAVYVNDIIHIVVDNVNFMLGTSNENSYLDRFWRQDLMVASFRKFATQHNCHVTLVMHPRKERDVEQLNNSSVFGGAKAVQEADNVLILQEKRSSTLRSQKYIQITKNRYDGELGIIPLEFDRDTYSLVMKKKAQKTSNSSSASLSSNPEHKCDR